MGKYIDAALAAHAAAEQAEENAEAAARAALVSRARQKAAPLWTNPADGKPLFDAAKQTRAEHVDQDAGLVVLSVLDDKGAPEISFAVYPDAADEPSRVSRFVDGEWTGLHGPVVADLDDVGAVLAEGN